MTSSHFNTVIIGAGQCGVPLARDLAASGRSTALIEAKFVGGTCINTGCTPTKTMVASARVAYLARRGEDYGVHTGPISIDMLKIRDRKRSIVESFRSSSESRLESTKNLELIHGLASFKSDREILIDLPSGKQTSVTAENIVIDTGCRAKILEIPGLSGTPYLDNESVMELDTVPEHLLVLGGGYIGLEFGQMFRRFGSRVTVLQHDPSLLAREDPEISEAITSILTDDGIEIILSADTERVSSRAGGGISLEIKAGGIGRTIAGSHLLVAAGREPNTRSLNLKAADVKIDKHGYIVVNDALQTSTPHIWAAGDVKGGPAFTHISYDDYRVIKQTLLTGKPGSIKGRLVPYTLFIDPELGRVGLTEAAAKEAGYTVKTASMPMTHVARALESDETRGLMKAVIDAKTDQILGCSFLGIEAGEIMTVVEVAMMGKLPYTSLRDAIFSHPGLSESLNNLFADVS